MTKISAWASKTLNIKLFLSLDLIIHSNPQTAGPSIYKRTIIGQMVYLLRLKNFNR